MFAIVRHPAAEWQQQLAHHLDRCILDPVVLGPDQTNLS
jgi:hypothetical protein